jgi:hypothetical protein
MYINKYKSTYTYIHIYIYLYISIYIHIYIGLLVAAMSDKRFFEDSGLLEHGAACLAAMSLRYLEPYCMYIYMYLYI